MSHDQEPMAEPTLDTLPGLGEPLHTAEEAPACVVSIRGTGVGRTIPVGRAILFGRHANATVQVNDSSVSRRHARLTRTDRGEYHLQDLDSRNGTMVNGVRIESRRLEAGDLIQIGENAVFKFVYRDPMEQQLLESQKMEAVGRMAGGVAHDFNNLLTVIASSAHMLREELDQPELDRALATELVDDLIDAYERSAELTRRLLDFARREDDDWEPIAIDKLLDRMTRLASRSFPPGVELEVEVDEHLMIRGSRPRLGQVIMNLCVNAADAMPMGGRMTVRASEIELDALSAARVDLRMGPGRYVRISVDDTGVGIPPEHLPRIFEPFYTTKDVGKGTGLGLAMVYGIVRRHGGHVGAWSEPGTGTRMTVHIPVLEASGDNSAPTGQYRVNRPDPITPGFALIIDDEPAVCRATSRMLQRSGWTVEAVSNGGDALALLADKVPDLIVLDCIMPGLSGLETLRQIRGIRPEVPVLMHSGTNDLTTEKALSEGATAFLRKPYSHNQLLEAVRLMRTAVTWTE